MVAPIERRTHSTNGQAQRRCHRPLRRAVVWCCAAMVSLTAARAADLQEVANLLRIGRYEECEKQALAALQGGEEGEEWYALKVRAEIARGKYEEALESLEQATRQHPASLTLFLIGATSAVSRTSATARKRP